MAHTYYKLQMQKSFGCDNPVFLEEKNYLLRTGHIFKRCTNPAPPMSRNCIVSDFLIFAFILKFRDIFGEIGFMPLKDL